MPSSHCLLLPSIVPCNTASRSCPTLPPTTCPTYCDFNDPTLAISSQFNVITHLVYRFIGPVIVRLSPAPHFIQLYSASVRLIYCPTLYSLQKNRPDNGFHYFHLRVKGKVKVNVDLYSLVAITPLKRSGMARVLKGSHSSTCTHPAFIR